LPFCRIYGCIFKIVLIFIHYFAADIECGTGVELALARALGGPVAFGRSLSMHRMDANKWHRISRYKYNN
jgi:hypothetical protein